MKKTLLTMALVTLTAVATYAQGSIQMLNSPTQKLKYEDTTGAALVDAPLGTVVGIFYGQSADNLTLARPTATITTTAGNFNGGAVYLLPGTTPVTGTVVFKIAAWFNKGGTTPSEALAGVASPGITHYGESATVTSLALGPTAGPGTVLFQSATGTNPNRIKAFTLSPVPEPSVVALGALGLGALLLRRRKA